MRHTTRDPKTGRFVSNPRHIKIWTDSKGMEEFHRLFKEELDLRMLKFKDFLKLEVCDIRSETKRQASLLRRDFIPKSKEEITSLLNDIFFQNKKGPTKGL